MEKVLSITREELLNPLQRVIGVVDRKQTMPILGHVLIECEANVLTMTASDSEIELVACVTLATPVDHFPSFTVSAHKLSDIARALPENAQISLAFEGERLVLMLGRSRFVLSTLPAAHFPKATREVYPHQFSLPQKEFRQLLSRTQFAMAIQDVRYFLNGLLLDIYPDHITAVATDGHRLALDVIPAQLLIDATQRCLLPRKTVLECIRVLEDIDDAVTIGFSNSQFSLHSNALTLTSKLIDGEFPDYRRIIPRAGLRSICVDRNLFKQALQRIAVLSHDKLKAARFEFKTNWLRIQAHNASQESAEDELMIEYDAPAFEIDFNIQYLLDVLSVLDSGDIRLSFSDDLCGLTMLEANSDRQGAFITMPMQV